MNYKNSYHFLPDKTFKALLVFTHLRRESRMCCGQCKILEIAQMDDVPFIGFCGNGSCLHP
jgi:hypothetical protein